MNRIHPAEQPIVHRHMLYNLYWYLASTVDLPNGSTVRQTLHTISSILSPRTSPIENQQLAILTQAVSRVPIWADAVITDQTRSESGLNACILTEPDGQIAVVFKGTGGGEWIDNGEGLSGIPEPNTYLTYPNGEPVSTTVAVDYATDQQVQALNWFRRVAHQNGWSAVSPVRISGHSKGGNKAQFIAIHSDIPTRCYSFDGQGFSPEAIASFADLLGNDWVRRRQRIWSLSADNDYVNVLGNRAMPAENVVFYRASMGEENPLWYHRIEVMLDRDGNLQPAVPQGELSRYIESVSHKLMQLPPAVRRYATLGVMNVLQTILGRGVPVNGDRVSPEETAIGIGVAIGTLLQTKPAAGGWNRLNG